jgi:hypothetical protein
MAASDFSSLCRCYDRINPFGLIGQSNSRFNDLCFAQDGTFQYYNGFGNLVESEVQYGTDEWYRFNFLIDMEWRRWSFDIHDSVGVDVLSASDLGFGSTSNTSYFNTIRSMCGASSDGKWYIDDVRLTQVVPAPSSLTAWIGVGVMVFGMEWWKKRRRRVRATA